MVIPVFAETFKINKFLPIYFLPFFGFFSKFIFLGSAGRAEPFKFTSGDGTSIDDVCSEAGVNKRSVETFRRYEDVERCLKTFA